MQSKPNLQNEKSSVFHLQNNLERKIAPIADLQGCLSLRMWTGKGQDTHPDTRVATPPSNNSFVASSDALSQVLSFHTKTAPSGFQQRYSPLACVQPIIAGGWSSCQVLNDDTKILTETDTETFIPIPDFPKPKTSKKLAKVSKPKCQSLLSSSQPVVVGWGREPSIATQIKTAATQTYVSTLNPIGAAF